MSDQHHEAKGVDSIIHRCIAQPISQCLDRRRVAAAGGVPKSSSLMQRSSSISNSDHSLLYISSDYNNTHKPRVNRQSVQYLVDFLDDSARHSEAAAITTLHLNEVGLVEKPSDGGLQILRTFFSKSSNMTPTKVKLTCCHFGNEQETLQLFVSFHTNRTVTDLKLASIWFLYGYYLGYLS
jgi:hypothetical protein